MITYTGLVIDEGKAIYRNVVVHGTYENYKPTKIVLTEELLKEWEETYEGEEVEVEPIDDSVDGWHPLHLARVYHPTTGTYSVEPVHKLFPIGDATHHKIPRNMIMSYIPSKLFYDMMLKNDELLKNHPTQAWREKAGRPRQGDIVWLYTIARRLDITLWQARARYILLSPDEWKELLNGEIDEDLSWNYVE